MIKLIRFGISLLVFQASIAFSNCPPATHVVYKCSLSFGKKYCAWTSTDGWYEGSDTKGQAIKPNMTAEYFVRALWFPYGNSDQEGATDCYYYANGNESLIKLFQQSAYGMVKRPTDDNWRKGWMPDFRHALICETSSDACHFNYASH
jgi:hypothetical protein